MQLSDGVISLRPVTGAEQSPIGISPPAAEAAEATGVTPDRIAAEAPIEAFAIVRSADEEVVGTLGVRAEAPYLHRDQAELTYAVDPQWRGRGLATRAVVLGCRYVAAAGLAEEVVLRIDPANAASVAVARRARFKYLRSTDVEGEGPLDWYAQAV
ncbi:GNAT family protein [Nocardia farcinica]|uniref:GNAT family N-acetyltransferase n=1 Tax=Nocardia farcinica TaxID=37329 RepID=UPI00311FAA36